MTIGFMKCDGEAVPIELNELEDTITYEDSITCLTYEFTGIDPESTKAADDDLLLMVEADDFEDDFGLIALDGGNYLKVACDDDTARVIDPCGSVVCNIPCYCCEQ